LTESLEGGRSWDKTRGGVKAKKKRGNKKRVRISHIGVWGPDTAGTLKRSRQKKNKVGQHLAVEETGGGGVLWEMD